MNEIPETRSPHERDRRARSPHEQVIPNTERLVHHMNVHQRENATKRKKEKGEYILLDKWDLILAELYAGLSPATRGFLEGSQAFELGAFADGSRHYLIVINDAQNIAWVQSQLARRIGTLIQQIAIGQRAELELTIVDRAEFEEVEGKEREGEVSHAK